MKRNKIADEHICPVARGAAQLADAWTFLILRELFLGNRRFEGLRTHTGMSPRSLTLRLGQLVEDGIVAKHALAAEPHRHDYRLTAKGLALWPVLMTLRQWGEQWAGPWPETGPPLALQHRGHAHALTVALHCRTCGEPVDAHAAHVHATPEALQARAEFAAGLSRPAPARRRARG
jgi:DNA-binding HxlR family transcriptional regulator